MDLLLSFLAAAVVVFAWLSTRKPSPDEGRLAKAAKPTECPFCNEGKPFQGRSRVEIDQYDKMWDRFSDLRIDRKSQAALNLAEKLIPQSPDFGHVILAEDIAACFYNLAIEKKPKAVLSLYDKLKESGTAIAFAEAHGMLPELASGLLVSIQDYTPEPETPAGLKKLAALLETDHPLMNYLREHQKEQLDAHMLSAEELVFDE